MKALIIGLGSIGKKHVDGLLKLYPNAQIYALRTYSNSEIYKSVINIYKKDQIPLDLDFIIISNITSYHAETILEMLDFGCPLFIEKPVVSNLSKVNKISCQLAKTGVQTYVACNLRFHPTLEFIKNYVATNSIRINEVSIYSGSYLPEWRSGADFRNIYSANKAMGGGVHLDLIHELDYCCWIFGFPESSISLQLSRSSLQIDAIDSARYLLTYPDFSACISLNYFRRDAKRVIEIVTENDTIVVDVLNNIVTSNISNKVLFQNNFNITETYTKQIDYFIKQIKLGRELMNNFENAIKVFKLAINANQETKEI